MLDLSKLTDAVGKVASLAASVATAVADRELAKAEAKAAVDAVTAAQADIDALTAQLVAAAGSSPVEAAGLAAVSEALFVAPAPLSFPATLAETYVAQGGALLPPMFPVASPAPATVDDLNAAIARLNAQAVV